MPPAPFFFFRMSLPILGILCFQTNFKIFRSSSKKNVLHGVPIMAQWLTNLTRNHEVAGLIPGLAHWVKAPALPCAVV